MVQIKNKKTIDGDTFKGDDGKYYRLANVNTPEKGKKGYVKATKELDKLLSDNTLVVKTVGKSYGRDVVELRKSGEKTTINNKMKRKGYK